MGKLILLALALSLGLPACDDDQAKSTSSQTRAPSWLDEVELEVVGVEPSFEENLEVSLELVNHADRAFTIEGLGKG